MRYEPSLVRLHEDSVRFVDALRFTEAETALPMRLLEKDYYCTVMLQYFAEKVPGLIFKGGTCLAKIHADFFRLSEDLDYRNFGLLSMSWTSMSTWSRLSPHLFGIQPLPWPCGGSPCASRLGLVCA